MVVKRAQLPKRICKWTRCQWKQSRCER